jgi:hypothetical protein
MADCPEMSLSVNNLLMRLFAKKYFGELVKKKYLMNGISMP